VLAEAFIGTLLVSGLQISASFAAAGQLAFRDSDFSDSESRLELIAAGWTVHVVRSLSRHADPLPTLA
jgi:hypothetical protein